MKREKLKAEIKGTKAKEENLKFKVENKRCR